jgi:two-component system sensor histidine kinase/response regulator
MAHKEIFRILLVEDNPGDVELMRRSLLVAESSRFEVHHADRLDTALERMREASFDLIVVDLSLPDSFGLESFAAVKEKAQDIPVVVLTGFEDETLGTNLMHLGAQDYVVKWQLQGNALVRCLRNAIEREGIDAELKRARETALAAVRSKSEFLAGMSHEIRTPLNSILGMADLLAETPLSSEQGRYVAVFRTAGEALLDLINGILDYSRVEAGRLELDVAAFDLGTLLESTMELLAFSAHKKRLTLAFEMTPDVPRRILGDAARLRQVLVNLVGNAIKFTEEGEVLVSLKRDSQSSEDVELHFQVRDTGIGIPRDKLAGIFESFSQADGGISRRYGGTGLGLSLCSGLVGLMHGRIGVESELGKGSRFWFSGRFGLLEASDEEALLGTPLRQGRVLVVDDCVTERRIIEDLLVRQGFEVVQVGNDAQAIAELRRVEAAGQTYDYVVLDCRMPRDGGFHVIESLEDIPWLRQRTLMMLTADHRPGDVSRCEEIGLGGWLVKPVKPSCFMDVILHVGEGLARPDSAGGDADPTPIARRILVVDDSEDNRDLVRAYLKRTPHELVMAENGKVALGEFRAGGFDLVLMDMEMPVMDGYSATKAIRAMERRSDTSTPVLALTAYAFQEERERSLAAGCDEHLTKPIRKRELLDAIERYTGAAPIRVQLADDLLELADGYLDNRRKDLEALRAAVGDGDFETVRVLGHNMKGNGRGYGFDGVSEIGAALEQAGCDALATAARRQLEALADYLERVEIAR